MERIAGKRCVNARCPLGISDHACVRNPIMPITLGPDLDDSASSGRPAPAGPVQVTVPAGSTHGRKLGLKGKGIPGEPPGDLYAVLNVAWPPADTEASRQLCQRMAETMAFDPRATLGG